MLILLDCRRRRYFAADRYGRHDDVSVTSVCWSPVSLCINDQCFLAPAIIQHQFSWSVRREFRPNNSSESTSAVSFYQYLLVVTHFMTGRDTQRDGSNIRWKKSGGWTKADKLIAYARRNRLNKAGTCDMRYHHRLLRQKAATSYK